MNIKLVSSLQHFRSFTFLFSLITFFPLLCIFGANVARSEVVIQTLTSSAQHIRAIVNCIFCASSVARLREFKSARLNNAKDREKSEGVRP